MRTAKGEHFPSQVQLDASILPVLDEILNDALASRRIRVHDPLQDGEPPGKIDRPTVVGVDQVQIPNLGALVEISDPGRGNFQKSLRQAVDHSEIGNSTLKCTEIAQEVAIVGR